METPGLFFYPGVGAGSSQPLPCEGLPCLPMHLLCSLKGFKCPRLCSSSLGALHLLLRPVELSCSLQPWDQLPCCGTWTALWVLAGMWCGLGECWEEAVFSLLFLAVCPLPSGRCCPSAFQPPWPAPPSQFLQGFGGFPVRLRLWCPSSCCLILEASHPPVCTRSALPLCPAGEDCFPGILMCPVSPTVT